MKKINIDLIKDLIISILIVICIALVISVIFYNKIPLNKVIPESQEYALTSEMQKALNESYTDEATEVVTTYYIDAADLKKFESTKEYDKGKKNPFAEESDSSETGNTINTNSIDSNTSTSSTNSNFYEDDGTK